MKSKCLHRNKFIGRLPLTRESGDLRFSVDKREICGQCLPFRKRTRTKECIITCEVFKHFLQQQQQQVKDKLKTYSICLNCIGVE
ncbi:hypothetical protein GQX74_002665 [Glossina fuscipes]|nr:hypothetical protein GQX74_002665 [Glossina fuscipes]